MVLQRRKQAFCQLPCACCQESLTLQLILLSQKLQAFCQQRLPCQVYYLMQGGALLCHGRHLPCQCQAVRRHWCLYLHCQRQHLLIVMQRLICKQLSRHKDGFCVMRSYQVVLILKPHQRSQLSTQLGHKSSCSVKSLCQVVTSSVLHQRGRFTLTPGHSSNPIFNPLWVTVVQPMHHQHQ